MNPVNIVLPSVRYRRKATYFAIGAVVVVSACIYLRFDPLLLFSDFGFVRDLLREMFPPNFGVLLTSKSVAFSVLQTIAMALLGTFYGCIIAFILAFLAAINIMPLRPVRAVVRIFLASVRVVPSLVIILIFVIAVGLGAFTGVLTLIVSTIGTFGKLFTEAIETTEVAPGEAIYSVGASRFQVIKYAIIPQVLPSFIANFLYSFDINTRAAFGLGIFGGGGIGFELFMAMRMLHYKDAMALIFFTIILIIIVEKLSDFLRKKIMRDARLR